MIHAPIVAPKDNPVGRFLFSLVFPTSSLTNVIVFMFICSMIGFSLALQWIGTPSFDQSFYGHDYIPALAPLYHAMGATTLLVPLAGLTLLFTLIASGTIRMRGRADTLLFPGFSLILYLLVAFGHVVAREMGSWLSILFVFGIMAALAGLQWLKEEALTWGLINAEGDPLNRIDLMLGVVVSSVAMYYFVSLKSMNIFDAAVAAYAVFLTAMVAYTVIKSLISTVYPAIDKLGDIS